MNEFQDAKEYKREQNVELHKKTANFATLIRLVQSLFTTTNQLSIGYK
jgi:hypothetical protein